MKSWAKKIIVYAALMYNFLLGTNYLVSGNFPSFLQKANAQSILAKSPSEDNYFKESKKEEFPSFKEVLKGTKKLEGLFTVFKGDEDSKIYLQVKSQQLNKNYLGTVTMESGIGESGIYSGQPLHDFVFYFQRVNDKLHFVVRNVKFRTEAGEPEQRSLQRSFSDSVLYALPIASIDSESKSILINLSDLLLQDLPDLTSLLKNSLYVDYTLEENRSYFGEVKNFPLNLEVDSIYGFSSSEGANIATLPDSRALSLKVHYSFSQLPENNNYTPRLADERVGYFISAYEDFSTNKAEPFVRYINRWHLEPSDPEASLSPPIKPIVFWIENAVPVEYRNAIREGVLMWNKAFEKAGFQNAVEVQQMPDNADWNPSDVRYNTIRWFNSIDAGLALGPSHVNPFTGEILDADIIIDANMARIAKQEYRALRGTNLSSIEQSLFPANRNINACQNNLFASQKSANKGQHLSNSVQQIHADSHLCYGIESSAQAAMGALTLSLVRDVTPNSAEMQEYLQQYLRLIVAHEVGHTLGLRHNFHGSTMLKPEELNNTEITHTKGLVSSVMDYLPVNLAPEGVQQGDYFPVMVGPYDEWAIEYGYKPNPDGAFKVIIPETEKRFLDGIAKESLHPELAYATDEDVIDINPDANRWDMSSDVLLYSQWQMDNARVMWKRLEKRYPLKGESYSNAVVLFNEILHHYWRNASLITQYIGGQSFKRYRDDANNSAFAPVSIDKQRQVLAKLQAYVFAEDAFNFSPQLLNQLAPSRWQNWGNAIPVSRLDYPIHERILTFQSLVMRSLFESERLHRMRDLELKTTPGQALSLPELFDTLQNSIWTEVADNRELKQISSIRRSLQREHLNILLEMVLRTPDVDVPEDARTLAWYELRQLRKDLSTCLRKQGKNLDTYTKAHLEETSDRITKALNAPLQSQ